MAVKKSLVIVESPAKANTINKYLGSDYEVVASLGHVRDLPKSRFGIDIEVLCLARRLEFGIAEVGVRWEHQDGSKVKWRDYVDVLVKVPRIVWSARSTSRRRFS